MRMEGQGGPHAGPHLGVLPTALHFLPFLLTLAVWLLLLVQG